MSNYNKLLTLVSKVDAINSKITACNTGAVVVSSAPYLSSANDSVTATVSNQISGFATESTLSGLNSKVTACNTGAVVVSSQPALSSATDSVTATVSNQISGYATESTLTSIDGKLTGLSPALASGTLLNKTTTSGTAETSSAIDAENYSNITIWGWESTSGSSSTIRVEISHDNSDWVPIQTEAGNYDASKGMIHFLNVRSEAKYFRIVFTPTVSVATSIYYSMK